MKVSYTALGMALNSQEKETLLESIGRAEVESRRYILSSKATPGLDYDDRLAQRLGVSRTTIFKMKSEGKLELIPMPGKIMMTERAIRRFEDGLGFAVEAEMSDRQAA